MGVKMRADKFIEYANTYQNNIPFTHTCMLRGIYIYIYCIKHYKKVSMRKLIQYIKNTVFIIAYEFIKCT